MMTVTSVPKDDLIRAKAYALWIEEGRPEGRAEAHWLRAVQLVDAEFKVEPLADAAKPKRKAAPRKRA